LAARARSTACSTSAASRGIITIRPLPARGTGIGTPWRPTLKRSKITSSGKRDAGCRRPSPHLISANLRRTLRCSDHGWRRDGARAPQRARPRRHRLLSAVAGFALLLRPRPEPSSGRGLTPIAPIPNYRFPVLNGRRRRIRRVRERTGIPKCSLPTSPRELWYSDAPRRRSRCGTGNTREFPFGGVGSASYLRRMPLCSQLGAPAILATVCRLGDLSGLKLPFG
jgi:hypothetical protein